MPNGECPVGSENAANIANLQEDVKELEARQRRIEEGILSIKRQLWFLTTALIVLYGVDKWPMLLKTILGGG